MKNLEYVKIGKSILFTCLTGLGGFGQKIKTEIFPGIFISQEKNILKQQKQFPEYRSWLGYDGWADTISNYFEIPLDQAKVALLNPRDPMDWVLTLSPEQTSQILKAATPFNSAMFSENIYQSWYNIFRNRGFHLYVYLKSPADIIKWNPKSWSHFQAQMKTKNHPLLDHIKWWEMNDSELYSIKRFGFASKFLDGVPEECPNPLLLHRIAIKKGKEAFELTLKDMVSFGVSHEELLPQYTRSERATIWRDCPDEKITILQKIEFFMKFLGLDGLMFNHCLESHNAHPNIPWDEWRIFIKWVLRRKDKLNKTRIVYGPAGQTATIYYRELLRHVSPKMLIRGEKTSWDTVQDSLQAEIQRRIAEQLGVDQPFPINPHLEKVIKRFPNSKVIKTTHALKYEGEIMDHCVGGYIQSVMNRQTYILHLGLEAPDGATLEISPDNNGMWRKHQCFAYHDKIPMLSLVEMAEKIVISLNKKGGERK
jgi:hypothetical protein